MELKYKATPITDFMQLFDAKGGLVKTPCLLPETRQVRLGRKKVVKE